LSLQICINLLSCLLHSLVLQLLGGSVTLIKFSSQCLSCSMFVRKRHQSTDPRLARSSQEKSQFWLSDSLKHLRLRCIGGTGSRDAKVLRLVDVGAAGSWVKRWDQSQKLSLQYKLIVPCSTALRAASPVLVVVLFLYTHSASLHTSWHRLTATDTSSNFLNYTKLNHIR